jgi:flagellar motor switch protein FliG
MSNHDLFSALFFFSQNGFLHLLPNTLAEVCLKIFPTFFFCEYQDKTANIIREMSRTDPKGLWKILNNIDKKKSDVSNNVTLEQFIEYFKNLNELSENEKDQEIDFDSVDTGRENVHNILNSPITEEEILRVVKKFKSNKASGYDDIVNEHIKSTINICSPPIHSNS